MQLGPSGSMRCSDGEFVQMHCKWTPVAKHREVLTKQTPTERGTDKGNRCALEELHGSVLKVAFYLETSAPLVAIGFCETSYKNYSG